MSVDDFFEKEDNVRDHSPKRKIKHTPKPKVKPRTKHHAEVYVLCLKEEGGKIFDTYEEAFQAARSAYPNWDVSQTDDGFYTHFSCGSRGHYYICPCPLLDERATSYAILLHNDHPEAVVSTHIERLVGFAYAKYPGCHYNGTTFKPMTEDEEVGWEEGLVIWPPGIYDF